MHSNKLLAMVPSYNGKFKFAVVLDKGEVGFYDTRYNHTTFGQRVASYLPETLMDVRGALALDSGTPEWAVSAEGMATVRGLLVREML
jgi:hypothetical protein